MNNRRWTSKSLFFVIIVQLLITLPAFAHDASISHPKMTKKAIEVKKIEHAGDKAFQNAMELNADNIIFGSEDEDYPEPGTWEARASKLYKDIRGDKGNYQRRMNGTITNYPNQNRPFMNHFFNPTTGLGLVPFISPTAPNAAQAYFNQSLDYYQRCHVSCSCTGARTVSQSYYDLGRALHALQDMSVPAHTNDIIHGLPFYGDNFENYVKDQIKNGWLDNSLWQFYSEDIASIGQAARDLAKDSHNANSYSIWDVFWRPPTRFFHKPGEPGVYYRVDLNNEELASLMSQLIPETINKTTGAINTYWDQKNGPPIRISCPGCDKPDDNFSISSPQLTGAQTSSSIDFSQVLDSYLRVGLKKNKTGLLAFKAVTDEMNNYFNLPQDSTESVIAAEGRKKT